tara:strand:- start:4981 stop:8340 length:3360 start_codon:yes stop_codon:yes gene_type:complete
MSIEIENNIFNIEDDDLDDIEYLEILSLDEIIKDNPHFIALSRNDIYENLNEMFQDRKRSESVTQLFYDILDNKKKECGNIDNYENYIFKVDAVKKNNELSIDDIKEDALYFKNLSKLHTTKHEDSKNKYFFSITYDPSSKNLKFKPKNRINALIEPNNEKYPVYYPVYPIDDVNLPLLASYYKIPVCTVNDYVYTKIAKHLSNSININYVESSNYKNVNNMIKSTRPSIYDVVKYLKDSFALDYSNIDNVFKRFDRSLDFINDKEFEMLCDHMIKLTKYEKERKNVNRPYKIKKSDLINKKLTFFEKLSSSIKLIKLDDKTINFLASLKESLEQYRVNNIIIDELVDIKKINIYNIINSIHYNDANPEELLNGIKASIKNINVNESIKAIDNILSTHENFENVIDEHEYMKILFEYSTDHIFDYDNDGKKYLLSYREAKDIKEGEDRENYEGGIDNEFIGEKIDLEDMDNIADDLDKNIYGVNKFNNFDKYLKNINYKNEEGFLEYLHIVLSIINEISNLSRLDIDYELLCNELFKYFKSVPTKYDRYRKAFIDANLEIDHISIADFIKIKPSMILEGLVKDQDDNINSIIYEINKHYLETLNDILAHSLSFWIVCLQEKILENTILIDENYLNNAFIDKWYLYGSPLNGLEKTAKNGVLPYLLEATLDFLANNNEYSINIDNFYDNVRTIIINKYSDFLKELKKKYELDNEKKKIERGIKEQVKLLKSYKEGNKEQLEKDFVNALLYMPGVNYKKIHKYLLGCCLKKIDDSFDTNGDLVKAGRKDLIAIKNFYGNNRVTNKSRGLRYVPELSGIKDEIMNDDNINIIKIKDYIYNIDNNDDIVNNWLDTMYNKSPLFPNNIIDEFKNNSKSIDKLIEDNINILAKTARVTNKEIMKNFTNKNINSQNILLNISKMLFSNKKEYEDDNINLLVDSAIKYIKEILKDIYKLNKILNDDIVFEINRINKYIVSRVICLPFSPESATNGGKIRSEVEIPNEFVELNAKNILSYLLNYFEISTFPTMDENIDFLNKKREENKQKKLNILNDKTVEENQLISNLKKAGIKNDLMDQEQDDNIDLNNINNMYNDEEKNEEKLSQIDEESDDDSMAYNDMGFIYA